MFQPTQWTVAKLSQCLYMGQLDRIKPYTVLLLERTVSIIQTCLAFKRLDNGRSTADSAILGGAVALSTSGPAGGVRIRPRGRRNDYRPEVN